MQDYTARPLPALPLTAVVKDILAQLDASARDVAEAIALPPACYTSEEWFEFEKRAVWDREWVCVGHTGHVANSGDYVAITINDDPLLLLRDEDGVIGVISAVCRHRGYVLGDARGNTPAFTCPFHGWCYDLHGTLIGAPEMSAHATIEELRQDHCLPRLRTEIWNGFVFVNFDGQAVPLAPRLKRLSREIANHHMDQMGAIPTVDWPDNPWNWKFMHENAIEPHHTWFLHKGVHDFAPSRLASFVEWDDADDGAVFHPTGFLELDANFNAAFTSLFPIIPTLTEAERKRVMFACVLPNLFFGAVPDGVFYYFILPQGANRLTIRVGLLYPESTLKAKTFDAKLKATIDGIVLYNDQDTVANTRVHRGLKSRFANRSRYAPKEKTLAQMNRWLIKRYRAYAQAVASGKRDVASSRH